MTRKDVFAKHRMKYLGVTVVNKRTGLLGKVVDVGEVFMRHALFPFKTLLTVRYEDPVEAARVGDASFDLGAFRSNWRMA